MVTFVNEGDPECGVIHITSGAFHTAAAVSAARSVRETNPWLAIDLFTDESNVDGPFDSVVAFSGGHRRLIVDYLAPQEAGSGKIGLPILLLSADSGDSRIAWRALG